MNEAFCEIREHLNTVNRIFAEICKRDSAGLETVEIREIRGEAKGTIPASMDYLIDANTGKVIATLNRTPTVGC